MISKKILLSLLVATAFSFGNSTFADSGFIYPFDKIAATKCKWDKWSSLSEDCKITLPRIEKADYQKYKTDNLYRRVYSVLWGATYDYGWDAGYGSHEWVDIATSEGTPVRSIADGTVINAGWQSGWGNVVSIEHTLSDGTKIYSNYAHLSKIIATKGKIKQGETLWEVGNTGNSYGNHLHFQIDTNSKFHPFYFGTCAKWIDTMTLVNKGLCRDELLASTIDPVAFIESGKLATTVTKTVIDKIQNTKPIKIEQKTIKSRAEILQEEINEFLKRTGFSVGLPADGNGSNLFVGSTLETSVSFTKAGTNGQSVAGNLPESGLEFVYDKKALRIFPETIVALDNGKRNFTITALKPGAYGISIKMGSTILAERRVIAFAKWDTKEPASAEIRVGKEMKIGESIPLVVLMKTKYGTVQTDMPYNGYWKLVATSGKAKFCNISKKSAGVTCDLSEKLGELTFTYKDTYRWVLNARVQPFWTDPVVVELVRVDTKRPTTFAKTKSISVALPKDLLKTNIYFDETVKALSRGWFALQSGYLTGDRTLLGSEAKSLIRNILTYQKLKAAGNKTIIKKIEEHRISVEKHLANIADYSTVDRATFAGLLLAAKGDPIASDGKKVFLDETGVRAPIISTMRILYNFRWRDQFATNYFQGEKAITKSEALYIAIIIFDKK